MHEQEIETLEGRLNGFAERVQQAETDRSSPHQMQQKVALLELQLKELTEWRKVIQGMATRPLESSSSATHEVPLLMTEEQLNVVNASLSGSLNNSWNRDCGRQNEPTAVSGTGFKHPEVLADKYIEGKTRHSGV